MGRSAGVLSWSRVEDSIELELHREPCNEIGSDSLDALEPFVEWVDRQRDWARAVIVHSSIPAGFSAGADLHELYAGMQQTSGDDRVAGVRTFLERIHRVLAAIESSPLPAIAAVHGVTFGGGLELALACDLIVADKSARFAFPELRLGLIPGFGGIPRLRRSAGVRVVADLLLTGRSIGAAKALEVGLVSQVAAEGEVLALARGVARQIAKLDVGAVGAAKQFIKPRTTLTDDEQRVEINLFCELCARPAVEAALAQFVGSASLQPYLP
jgi:enoyl-CoA hydratase